MNDPALEIAPWQVIEEDFYRAMAADMKGNWISQGIIMLIVGVGILNTVLMALLERTREYAVLRALGTRPGVLVRMILWEVLFLATLGVGVGFLLSLAGNAWFASVGMALPEGIEYGGMPFERMYGSLSPQVFWAPALLTWTTAALVGLFPALRAARIRPAEGLRAT
ncbi:MAG: hypothetical protein KatS3mg115_0466 [Candidatus Poribacteria bacterium]|nr:MAG: hypothetical protein KatS3mg115_0466 [Candidatus Poribacteria bacterium]